MMKRINLLLNIKPSEAKLVRHLFLVQYFLGVATAFLFTSSLTLILSSYPVTVFPKIYILAAAFLLLANVLYSKLEARLAPEKLLQAVVAFSAVSILLHWVCLTFLTSVWLPLLLGVWNMVIYMLVGYAFWGMTAILFNVRESKRLFSVVGAGDIPAKMLGYFSVTALVPLIGVVNLLWVSVIAFAVVDVLLRQFDYKSRIRAVHTMEAHAHETHQPKNEPIVKRYFHNRLIFFIAFWSLLSYTIYSLIDFTFLSEIKHRYTTDHELATFIAVFFAFGRLIAIGIKLLFSSRVIARLGLANCLLITPVLLLTVNGFIVLFGGTLEWHLYAFGGMVLLSEILRSTLQEPVFFVLFQPLNPHSRLKGHLIAKGHTLPLALLVVGFSLMLYLEYYGHSHISILFMSQLLLFLLVIWGASVFLVRNAYRSTLEGVIQKGYFTGSELFLNDQSVRQVLVQKATSNDPKVAIHALDLLERSGYSDLDALLLRQLQQGQRELREYALLRIIENQKQSALPLIREQLLQETDEVVLALLVKAQYLLENEVLEYREAAVTSWSKKSKKAALTGLLLRKSADADAVVAQELLRMSCSDQPDEKLLAIDIIKESRRGGYERVLETLLKDKERLVFTSAMEAVGDTREVLLLEPLVQAGLSRNAPLPLRRALLHYGEALFSTAYIKNTVYPMALQPVLVQVAAKAKGESSTAFLERLVQEKGEDAAGAVDALWQKKATVSAATQRAISKLMKASLKQSVLKADYYVQLIAHPEFKPLQDAICSEIHQDIQHQFKCMALLYKRKQVERVMELYNQRDSSKVYNAIEMLELIIPQKLFINLNMLLELEQDVKRGQLNRHPARQLSVGSLIGEILQENKAGFNCWTKSVACYMIPRLQGEEVPAQALENSTNLQDPLFRETREYVLTTLN